jgi:hypothetical protein
MIAQAGSAPNGFIVRISDFVGARNSFHQAVDNGRLLRCKFRAPFVAASGRQTKSEGRGSHLRNKFPLAFFSAKTMLG